MTRQPSHKPNTMKKSVARIGKNFSSHADRVADIIIDQGKKAKGTRAKEVTREAFSLFKDIRQDFFVGAAYGMGKLSAETMRTCRSLFNFLKK